VVDNTVAVNPSFATKGIVAKLWFGGQGNGPVRARIKVEVGKLSELVPLSI